MRILITPIEIQNKYEKIVNKIDEIISINNQKIEKFEELYKRKCNDYSNVNNFKNEE